MRSTLNGGGSLSSALAQVTGADAAAAPTSSPPSTARRSGRVNRLASAMTDRARFQHAVAHAYGTDRT
jgi:hypothetical protein